MTSRLDSALAKVLLSGDAGVRLEKSAVEAAVQQQLIHGGALDTLLLEMGVVSEPALADALSSAWGTPPVDPAVFEQGDDDAAAKLPRRMAVAMGLYPFRVDADGTLHVACRAPLDEGLITEVGGLIGCPVIAHVVPECRLVQGLHTAYEQPVDERFVALLRQLAPRTAIASADVEERGPRGGADDVVVSWDLVEAMAHLAAQDSRDGIARVAVTFARRFLPFAAVFGVRDGMAVGWHRAGPCEGALFESRPFPIPSTGFLPQALTLPSPALLRPEQDDGTAAFFGWVGRRRPKSVLVVPIVVARRPVGALYADGGVRQRDPRDVGELVAFGARLGPAFEALLRARHRQHPSIFPQPASLLPAEVAPTTPTTSAPGVSPAFIVAPPGADVAPRDGTSPFARDYVNSSPGVLTQPPTATATPTTSTGDTDTTPAIVLSGVGAPMLDEHLAARLQAQQLQSDRLSDRHSDRHRDSDGDDDGATRSALFRVADDNAPVAWQGALKETVEKGLQGGTSDEDDDLNWEDVVYDPIHAAELDGGGKPQASFPALSSAALVDLYGDGEGPPGDEDEPAATSAGEAGRALAGGDAGSSSTPVLATLSHRDVVEYLFAGDDEVVARAVRELITRGLAAVPALAERFPGRLRADPFDRGENVRSAAQLGPLIEVLWRLSGDGLDAAIPHVDSRYPAHRFAAVLLFAQTPDARAIDLLRSRLHDAEPRIRDLAAEALMPFLAHPRFESLLLHLRERAGESSRPYPLEARRRAVELLGAFRDVGSVPLLIGLLAHTDIADTARRALRAITLQDLGARAKSWEKWWAKAKKKSRLDWLLDGLGSEELELRAAAHRELADLAGDDFGYRADADKRSRQRAVEVWQQWWADEQTRAPAPRAAQLVS